jgi:hypothetical protein
MNLPTTKPWWEWLALILGIIGGLKTMYDFGVSLFLNRPRITGEVEHMFVRSQTGSDPILNPLGSGKYSSAFFCEVLIHIYAINKGRKETSVRGWEVRIRHGCREIVATLFYPSTAPLHPLWVRSREAGFPEMKFMPCGASVMFECNKGFNGSLAFLVKGITKTELLTDSRLRAIAIDASGRRHSLKSFPMKTDETPGLL